MSRIGRPLAITALAWPAMSPSRQPPDRKPATKPSATTIWVPNGRGPPPSNPTIVAKATGSPAASAARSAGRTSSTKPNTGQAGRFMSANMAPAPRQRQPSGRRSLSEVRGLWTVLVDGLETNDGVSNEGQANATVGVDWPTLRLGLVE